MATDIVTELRILRGIGGEHRFAENYQRQSQKVRRLGTRLGTWQGVVEAISVLLSGLLLVVLVYLGSRQLLTGALTMRQLIQFLRLRDVPRYPMQAIFDFGHKWVQGLVSASKTTIALQGSPGALTATSSPPPMPRDSSGSPTSTAPWSAPSSQCDPAPPKWRATPAGPLKASTSWKEKPGGCCASRNQKTEASYGPRRASGTTATPSGRR